MTSELDRSAERLIRHVQEHVFEDKISNLRQVKTIKTFSKLLSLNPFLDSNGLLRVGGKLQAVTLNFERKHPIVLPDKHRLTKLIFEREHRRLLHAGPQALLAMVHSRYWPLNRRNLARRTFHECIV